MATVKPNPYIIAILGAVGLTIVVELFKTITKSVVPVNEPRNSHELGVFLLITSALFLLVNLVLFFRLLHKLDKLDEDNLTVDKDTINQHTKTIHFQAETIQMLESQNKSLMETRANVATLEIIRNKEINYPTGRRLSIAMHDKHLDKDRIFAKIIADNIEKGVIYEYYISETMPTATRHLLQKWCEGIKEYTTHNEIDTRLFIRLIKPDLLLHTTVLVDKTTSTSEGWFMPDYDKDENFIILINESYGEHLYITMKSNMNTWDSSGEQIAFSQALIN